MDIYGVTPIDTALNVAGFNLSQLLMEFIFGKSGIGIAVGVVGYLLLLWRLSRTGKLGAIWVYSALILVLVLLLLPSHALTNYKSVQESNDSSTPKAVELKNALVSFDRIPNIFAFISHGTDLVMLGMIGAFDKVFPEWGKFMVNTNQIYEQLRYIREAVRLGFLDTGLRSQFNAFINDHYIPVLTRSVHESKALTFNELTQYYTADEKKQWRDLTHKIDAYFNNDLYLKAESCKKLSLLMGISYDDLKSLIISSFARRVMLQSETSRNIDPFDGCFFMIKAFPYIEGVAQIILAVTFPLMLLVMLINSDLTVFVTYIRNFFWIKSWNLCIAVSFYVSMFIAHIQANHGKDIGWAWEYPYFATAFVVLVPIMVVLTRVVFNKGGVL